MADSVEKRGVDLRTRVKRLGVKEKTRRKKVQSEILAYQEKQGLPEELHEGGRPKSSYVRVWCPEGRGECMQQG